MGGWRNWIKTVTRATEEAIKMKRRGTNVKKNWDQCQQKTSEVRWVSVTANI